MNILEEIQNCPVEWKELWEVTIWDKKFNSVPTYKQLETDKYEYLLAKELSQIVSENGDVKILTTSPSNLWTSEYMVSWEFYEKEIIAIPWGGNPVVQYYKGKFITGDNRIARVKKSSELSTKFLYYYLMNNLQIISSFYRGSGIKHPDMSKVLDLKIPVPPLEIQEKIVQTLDKMTEYATELTSELTSRNKQYSYYRDKLLSFEDEIYQVEWKELREVCEIVRGIRITKKELLKEGYPVVSGGTSFMGYTNEYNREKNTITIAQYGTAGYVNWQTEKFWANDVCFSVYPKESISNKYLYYFLMNKQDYLYEISNRTAVPYSISKEKILRIKIPIPPLEIQEKIVQILDKFNTVCNDLNIGLPKEIELRQKQYEYWREQLLNFNK